MKTPTETGILLVDPQALFRNALRSLIEPCEGLYVVGEASDGREAVELAMEHRPEILVAEIVLPHLSGFEVAQRLRQGRCPSKILILSEWCTGKHVEEALHSGVSAYVSKNESADELMRAIEALRDGKSYVSPVAAEHLIESVSDGLASSSARVLSSREREVLQLVAEGFSSKEIASQLGVSTRTIDSHRANLMEKLEIHKISGLVRFAIREGIIRP